MPDFEKWWNDLKKHRKRLRHWLPHWRALATRIGDGRRIRYFTLCARSMIDVFMLVEDGLLRIDPDNYSIGRVQFCERDQEQFVEIREMISREDAGFLGELEKVVLFQDDDFTAQFPTPESINAQLEDEGLQNELVDKLLLKRTFFNVRSSFPYDFINLDFCDYYYPRPPDMLRVNRTVEKFLDWQRRSSGDADNVMLEEFILAVTCRYDVGFPKEAEARLRELIHNNCATSPQYSAEMQRTRGTALVDEWIKKDRQDFFLAGWPKDIAGSAREYGWATEILDYVYYSRVGDESNPYVIACLVLRFSRPRPLLSHIPTALFALNPGNRTFIDEIDRDSPEGQRLLQSLRNIVVLHNGQAARKRRPPLPNP